MTLDELVVDLKLDTTQFDDEQKKALENFRKFQESLDKRLSNVEHSGRKAGYGIDNITNAAQGLFTVLAGSSMASFAKSTMDSAAATGRMAVNIGSATNELSAFGRMVERNGGNADTAAGSLKGLTDQMNRLNTFGEGSPELFKFLGIIGGKQGDNALDTFMRFADWAEKNKNNPGLVNIIGQAGGLDQGTINTALKGGTQVLKEFNAAMSQAVSPAQSAAMIRMQESWVTLGQKIGDVGRIIVTDVEPAFSSVSRGASNWIEHNEQLAVTLGKILASIVALSALKPAAWLLRLLGLGALASPTGLAIGAAAGVAGYGASQLSPGFVASMNQRFPMLGQIDAALGLGGSSGSSGAFQSQKEKEAFIRASARKAGIDPDIAMAVAKSEGFNQFSGDNGTSFGAFQLHVTPGGRGHAVGDEFKRLTGLDPSDKSNEREGIMFAMEWAKRHGWSDFHGAANSGIGPRQGINVESMEITVKTDAKDPKAQGRAVGDAVKERLSTLTTPANTGLN